MDDVLVEMEAIREFVVESLAEFRSELSAMNFKFSPLTRKQMNWTTRTKISVRSTQDWRKELKTFFSQAETVPQIQANENTFQMTRRRMRTTKPASPPLWTTSVHK